MSEGYKINLTRETVQRLTSFYPYEDRPTSRRRRQKIRRQQAQWWRAKKQFLYNPVVGITAKTDDDTGLTKMVISHANGQNYIELMIGSCHASGPAIDFLTKL